MSLTHETIKETLAAQFGDKILGWEESYGMLSFTIQHDHNLKALTFLKKSNQKHNRIRQHYYYYRHIRAQDR